MIYSILTKTYGKALHFCLQIFDLQTVKNNQQPAHATSGIPVSIIKG